MSEFGKRLEKLRIREGLSVSEVARHISVSTSTYREWEYGRQIKGEPYEKLASILNVSLNELLTGKKLKLEIQISQIEEAVKNIKALL